MKGASCLIGLLCMLLMGCATTPFPPPDPFGASGEKLNRIPARFEARLAPQFEQVNALVFRFWGKEIAALGMLSVNRPERSFSVACMTPIGVRLFDVVCTQGQIEGRVALPELNARGGDLALAAGNDLARAYFDWSPSEEATQKVKWGRLIFSETDASGRTEYRYAWKEGRLAEKIRFEAGRLSWKVDYREYQESPEGLIPTGMVIVNRKYGYRLIVASREMKE